MSIAKRRNSLAGQYVSRTIEMLESPAYRVLSRAALMVLSRVEIELGHHGGNDMDNLPVTNEDFIAYGMHKDTIAPAVREAEALGFLRVKRGRGGNAEHRTPSKFGLTYAHHINAKRKPPTDDWRRFKTIEEAEQVAKAARKMKDPRAVAYGKFRPKRKTKPTPGFRQISPPESGAENGNSHPRNPGLQVHPRNPGPLSIFRVGTATEPSAEPAPPHGIGHNQGPPLNGANPPTSAPKLTDEQRIEARKQRQVNQNRYK